MASMKVGKPYLIRWFDAYGIDDTWVPVAEVKDKPRKVESVGFLVEGAVDGYYTLVCSYDKTAKHITAGIHIPIVNVIEMVPLTE